MPCQNVIIVGDFKWDNPKSLWDPSMRLLHVRGHIRSGSTLMCKLGPSIFPIERALVISIEWLVWLCRKKVTRQTGDIAVGMPRGITYLWIIKWKRKRKTFTLVLINTRELRISWWCPTGSIRFVHVCNCGSSPGSQRTLLHLKLWNCDVTSSTGRVGGYGANEIWIWWPVRRWADYCPEMN